MNEADDERRTPGYIRCARAQGGTGQGVPIGAESGRSPAPTAYLYLEKTAYLYLEKVAVVDGWRHWPGHWSWLG